MAFPDEPLDMRLELLLGGVWTTVTGVRKNPPVTITSGRADEASVVSPASCELHLRNTDARWSPRNPDSVYFGQLLRNTQARISVPYGSSYAWLDGAAGARVNCPDAAALGIVGDLDVRVEAELVSWRAPVDLMSKWEGTTQHSWSLQVNGDGRLCLTWTVDGAFGGYRQVVSTVPIPGRRGVPLAVRATLDVNNGASGNTVAFWTADSLAGTWVQLGEQVTEAGTTSIFDSTAALCIGDNPSLKDIPLATGGSAAPFTSDVPVSGRVRKAEVRSGIAGTVVANPDFTAKTPGIASFADTATAPNTWSVTATGAAIDNRDYRMHGEISDWRQQSVRSGKQVWTPIEISGILRRLNQGSTPLRSVMYRANTLATDAFLAPPVAYWPCEDGTEATQLAGALPGVRPMRITGARNLASDNGFAVSDALPTVAGGTWSGKVPAYTPVAGASHVRFLLAIPAAGLTNNAIIARIGTTGAAARFDVIYTTAASGTMTLSAYDADGGLIASVGQAALNGKRMLVGVSLTPGGALGDFTLNNHIVGETGAAGSSGSLGGSSVGVIKTVAIGVGGLLDAAAVGHIAVAPDAAWLFYGDSDLDGYAGESAGRRIQRLCREEDIPFRAVGDLNSTAKLGPQRSAPLTELLRAAAETDMGILSEARDMVGLEYRPRVDLYNQPDTLALDFAAPGEVAPDLEPSEDDQGVVNIAAITRDGGSSARYALDEGPNSVPAIGPYEKPVTSAVAADAQLLDEASWRVHVGSVDAAQVRSVGVKLHRLPASFATLASRLQFGDVIAVANPPSWVGADTVRMLAQGCTEVLRPFKREMTFNTTPAAPWTVGVRNDPSLGRRDTSHSVLSGPINTTATSINFSSSNSPKWINSGDRLTLNPDFEVDASNWTAAGCTVTRVPTPGTPPFCGSWSGLITPDGVTATVAAESSTGAVVAGNTYRMHGWMRCARARAVELTVNWYTAGLVYITTTLNTINVAADTWTLFDFTVVAPATSAFGRVRPRMGTTPLVSDLLWFDVCFLGTPGGWADHFPFYVGVGGEQLLVRAITGAVDPQAVVVARSQNGVIKSHALASDVRLWQSCERAL